MGVSALLPGESACCSPVRPPPPPGPGALLDVCSHCRPRPRSSRFSNACAVSWGCSDGRMRSRCARTAAARTQPLAAAAAWGSARPRCRRHRACLAMARTRRSPAISRPRLSSSSRQPRSGMPEALARPDGRSPQAGRLATALQRRSCWRLPRRWVRLLPGRCAPITSLPCLVTLVWRLRPQHLPRVP